MEDAQELADCGFRGAKRIAASLIAGKADLELSRDLVRMRDDLPLDVSVAAARWEGADRERLGGFFDRLGIGGLMDRVPKFRA